ncbi:phosphatase PAP2 family protein [Robertmurraya yapensis]|uniref:Phosphatase PAP2 family protein n=2 Tax=Bacillaceae TaxID=186817 RepID=A0A431VYY0_9BACI|nr:phosphatase PAP2 family protein [Bacillus yapensis]RTR28482.1 phosphatase PAP2 family protein [Bacillus yapensis]TKS94543.1 phosphatase PAP2 family protein [Bacillus yapensis]
MKIRNPSLLILSLLLLCSFILLARSLDTVIVDTFDTQIIQAIQLIKQPFLTLVMRFFSFIGDIIPVMIISVILFIILYKVFHHRKELILFSIVLLGSTAFNIGLKAYYQRERPTLYTMVTEESFSFPSGHSMAALSLYGILTFLLWRHIPRQSGRIVLITISTFILLMIGVSRIYLGAHFPSDVLGAYLFSGFWLVFTIWGFKNFKLSS